MIKAATDGRLDIVQGLVEAGVSESLYGTAFRIAASNGHLDIVQYLVEEGPIALRSQANINSGTVLLSSAYRGRLNIVQYLIEKCHDHIRARDKREALISAAAKGQLEVLRYLFEQVPEALHVPANNQDGRLVLDASNGHQYLFRKGLEVFRYFFGQIPEASIVPADIEDERILFIPASNGHLNIVEYLIGKGIPANFKNGEALIHSTLNGHTNVFDYLVKQYREMEIQIPETLLLEILFRAATDGYLTVVRYLFEQLPDTSHFPVVQDGSVLIWAASKDRYNVVLYLVEQFHKMQIRIPGRVLTNAATTGR